MAGVGNIEAFTILFTIGLAAGTVLTGMVPGTVVAALSSLLLLLLGLPFIFRERIVRFQEARLIPLLFTCFFALGMFCSLLSSFDYVHCSSALEELSARAVERLRAHIDGLPFRSESTAPLLKAFLSGDRSGLSRETVAVFRSSGASHLLALSGLHMGIIYLIFDKLSYPLGRSPLARRLRYALIVSLSGFFTLMTGASPSIVRAFLFIFIGESLRLAGRERKASRVLCLALFAQLILDPEAIRSVGFQLSYLAMAGIFLIYPSLERLYPDGIRHDPLRWIWKSAALTISCQLFTAPLSWYYFHSFPRHFLLTNLLALPLTSLVIGSAVLCLSWSALFPCPALILDATDYLCSSLLWVLQIISGM